MSEKSPRPQEPSAGEEDAVPASEPAGPPAAVRPAPPDESDPGPARFYGPI
jgi:hypothetical protein